MVNRTFILIAALVLPCYAGDEDAPGQHRYLDVVKTFVETMMDRGTDRYGKVQSPLFAAMLDLDTMSLPKPTDIDELPQRQSGHVKAIGYGLPDPPVGIRPGDRAPFGNNLEHDIMLLRTMYELSAVTGDKKYADHADSTLRFWLTHCQSPETGLMAGGEHMSWDFRHEKAYGNIHEVFRRFPFYDKLYGISPHRALRLADGLWLSQIGNKKVGDFSRHADWKSYNAHTGAAYPRHAGFYIWAYANAYVQSRDPKYIERIEVLIESRTGRRLQPESLLVQAGSFKPEHSTDPTLRVMLWDAAELAPRRRAAWRKLVRELDEKALAALGRQREARPAPEEANPVEQEKLAKLYPQLARFSRRIVPRWPGTESTTLSALWRLRYGSAGVSGAALRDFTHYRQTKDNRFLRLAEQVADRYIEEGIPEKKDDLWPKACGQVISLMLVLAHENGIPEAKQKRYKAFARQVADMSIGLFSKNGLFRADGQARHYEAITGADDLVWALLQLHSALKRPNQLLGHIDVNF